MKFKDVVLGKRYKFEATQSSWNSEFNGVIFKIIEINQDFDLVGEVMKASSEFKRKYNDRTYKINNSGGRECPLILLNEKPLTYKEAMRILDEQI